jgi:ribosomal protein S18 acetylase RimI-like enzyme
MKPIRIVEAGSDGDYRAARALFEEYARTLGADILCFQGFDQELEQLASMYGPPRGRLLIAWRESQPVGCVALRAIEPGICEMKRLYVRREARGIGLGKELAAAIVERARTDGYRSMVLDTLRSMVEARVIYRSLGFVQREPYYANPQQGVTFMELRLQQTSCTATP